MQREIIREERKNSIPPAIARRVLLSTEHAGEATALGKLPTVDHESLLGLYASIVATVLPPCAVPPAISTKKKTVEPHLGMIISSN